jgi:hypothetical protein
MLPPKDLLPPGPWTVRNGRVMDGTGRVVAVVFAMRYPHVIAEYLAAVPELIERPDPLALEVLRAELADARKEIVDLEKHIDELETALK